MLGYGFAIPSNPFDHFSVGLRVPPGSPLAQTRTWYPDKKKDADFQCYIFNINHPRTKSASCLEASVFSFDLLDSISILCANDRELQTMFESKKTYIGAKLASRTKSDNRNLLHTFAQLYRECQQRLTRLQGSDPKSNGEVARTPQQRYAQIYRDSQVEILATATLVCKYTLLRARTNQSIEEVLQIIPAASDSSHLDQTATSNLQRLVHRHVPLTQSHELFGFAELSQFLPTEESKAVLAILETIPRSTPDSPRVRLAVLLAVLRSTKLRLRPRFRTWLDKLDSWYDSSWSTLSTDLDGSSDAENIHTLLTQLAESAEKHTHGQILLSQGLLSGKSLGESIDLKGLIWAWNVIGEESVQVPNGLVPARDGGGEEDAGSLLLYIPQ
jgi:hypothetical protein